jgi:hypothetical protein
MTHPPPPVLYRHPTRSEIIDLAAAEGHDADIPTNMGSIHQVPSHTSARPASIHEKKKELPKAMEKDIEKGASPCSISSADEPGPEEEEAEHDPNIIDFDGPNDPENPMNWNDEEVGHGSFDLRHHIPHATGKLAVRARCAGSHAGVPLDERAARRFHGVGVCAWVRVWTADYRAAFGNVWTATVVSCL